MFDFSSLQRIHLDIEVGEHANDYRQIAEKDKLTELQLRVRQLLDQVEQIQKEQNYQRVRTWCAHAILYFINSWEPLFCGVNSKWDSIITKKL